ncbi:MAG: hypothetical protein R3C19_06455 [Planctomycetaceae bacterium]
MKFLTLLAGVSTLAITCTASATAGGHGLLGLRPFHHAADCGCAQPAASCAMPTCAMPTCAGPTCAAPVVHAPVLEPGCHCGAAVSGCCGLGGAAGLAGLYAGGGYAAGGSLTGYEGLPNMDGGGIHNRYPYHSYRRPWAHPGPASTNINIVW